MFELDSPEAFTESSTGLAGVDLDPLLLNAALQGTRVGLSMTHTNVVPVGASRLTNARHAITVVVGLVGAGSGSLALNFSEAAAIHLTSRLLGTPQQDFNEDCVDAVMELGNMVAGAIKAVLRDTEYAISNISLPSLILGQSHLMACARGIRTVSVEHELSDLPFSAMNGRYLSTTVSLLRGAGSV